jgi:RNA polymerase sigma-70 factor (ECF subfamily)
VTAEQTAEQAVEQAFRSERAAILATLIRHVGDFQIAEDAVQDAFAAAVEAWRRDGVPQVPAAWITVTARRKAIDRLRRDRSLAHRAERLAELMDLDSQVQPEPTEEPTIDDDRLRLIFTCCHPALDLPTQVALTLRVVGGLSTREIARAFLVAEPTMGKRIVRAKRKISDAHIPYRVPDVGELPARVAGVLRVVYLIFNEGYAATAGDRLVRAELCDEAIRLGALLTAILPEQAEVWGLQSLMLLHDSRREARVDAEGSYAGLLEQDRSLWDTASIQHGLQALDHAVRLRRPGRYQLEAAITALHVQAADPDAVDWAQIAALYGALGRVSPSPVVELNRVASVGFAEGPEVALRLLAPLLTNPALQAYQPLYATHAELLSRTGDGQGAAQAYRRAIELADNEVEREELVRRLAGLADRDGGAADVDPGVVADRNVDHDQ